MRYLLIAAWLAGGASWAAADGRLIDDNTFAVSPPGQLAVDAGLVIATPSALPTGLAVGVGTNVSYDYTCWLSYGAGLAVTTLTEASTDWTVTHIDVRPRVFGALRHTFGRGNLQLRLAVGPTIVHESRTRSQSSRAGRMDLDTTATAALPATELEAIFVVHVAGPWVGQIHAGPSVDRFDGAQRFGWIAGIAIGWQP